LNNTKPPLDNEMVRQAIAMGIDRQAIVDKFYPPGSSVASHFTPCSIPGGCEGEDWYEYDLEAAKALLADSGVELPSTWSWRIATWCAYLPSVTRSRGRQAQAGSDIQSTIDVQESAPSWTMPPRQPGTLHAGLGWRYPDATNFLDSHFGTGANASFGTSGMTSTEPLAKAASLSDQAERNKLYAEANDAIKLHVPMVPVAHGGSATVWKAAAEGAHSSPLGNEAFKVAEISGQDTFVWMQNAEPLSLYCADETDGESLRACEQIFDPLLSYRIGSTEVEPGLATGAANDDLTEWTCALRSGVKFWTGRR
jgi:ABC-type transport system substrate-binding protein